jgi:hypothetical protein
VWFLSVNLLLGSKKVDGWFPVGYGKGMGHGTDGT